MRNFISPDVFFLIEDDQALLWNCKTHEQYLIGIDYFSELLNLENPEDLSKIKELKDAGVIVASHDNPEWGWDVLSRLFHVGTKDLLHEDAVKSTKEYYAKYLDECNEISQNVPEFFQSKDGELIDLPKPNIEALDEKFCDVLKLRKTSRSFNGKSVSLQSLSNTLFASFGLIHGEWTELNEQGLKIAGVRKSSPSSGGLHAEEAYVVVYNVEGLESGLYYYRPQDHKLNTLKLGQFDEKTKLFHQNQPFGDGMAFGVYITSRLDKYWWKYKHSRTYRIVMLDIGHVSQTFLLSATAAGFNTWITGVLQDSAVEEFLGIDGFRETVILFVGAGYGSNESFPTQYLKN